ncbi:hypothetical protein GEV33_010240 [Tenebrio molitor]|uniref:Uncharacterized protein n=1 Tax=Tenebrio molitor TaxID=7067 RepID=A0A8J6HDK7_TENMO|nr:hypothetical protein GEV33_010240 [Tenebrio molitor]
MDYKEKVNDADIDEGFPADIKEAANRATLDLLPSKSRKQYNIAYNRFLEWCKHKKVEGKFSENYLTTVIKDEPPVVGLWACPWLSDQISNVKNNARLPFSVNKISDDSRDAEMCDKTCDTDEELNVDVENDDTLCPVDLTRRQDKFTSFENLIPSNKTDSSSDFISFKDMKRSESVCSDDVSRSESPRDQSPSVVPHQNRRLAFSVENILDPNKFTGRQGVYSDGICCWKPHDGSRGSPEYDDSETALHGRE